MNKKTLLGAGFALALLFSPFHQACAPETTGDLRKMDTIAHRGASGYAPENTIAAFDKALEMKVDYIEIDVQRSKDGELVVMHDNKVDRTTDGTGYIKDLTFEQLRSLDAGSWKGEQFTGEKISTFGEVLDRYHGKIGILIELKSPELYPGIEESVAQELIERNLDYPQNEKIIIQSFNFESMKKIDALLPKVPIGVLTSSKAHTTEQALEDFATYADYFNPIYGIVTEDLVNQVHSHGMKISSWTVRSHESAEFLLSMNVDAIITDFPDYVDLRN
ncbi:glycerophosphodiester phosphodiesterase family protein [Peribacillus sp. NJ11]|uniref:glycerophosphodiester phosphodiesterase n=1 Tax=Peribacillus sp. NJ11 TaxID=3055861 RepID=UPI0025A01EF8|nr:glycerophosphodiester phosphodiesterase family protein [Peribacillus sp. NJ11]MDM5224393.1 glycerophosphodiester phosphodiesterase family protein [Peribacillus sp. NJ11]